MIDPWDGWIALSFSSRYRHAYTLEASSDLGIADPFAGLFPITGAGPSTDMLFHDPAAATVPRRFYRVSQD